MPEVGALKRYFAASKFWKELLGAVFGGMGGGTPQFDSSFDTASTPAASGGRGSSPSSTRHPFPTG